jgi:hypothetical protein
MTLAQLDPSAKAPWTSTTFFTDGATGAAAPERLTANNGMIATVKMSNGTTWVLTIPLNSNVMCFMIGTLVDSSISPV